MWFYYLNQWARIYAPLKCCWMHFSYVSYSAEWLNWLLCKPNWRFREKRTVFWSNSCKLHCSMQFNANLFPNRLFAFIESNHMRTIWMISLKWISFICLGAIRLILSSGCIHTSHMPTHQFDRLLYDCMDICYRQIIICHCGWWSYFALVNSVRFYFQSQFLSLIQFIFDFASIFFCFSFHPSGYY